MKQRASRLQLISRLKQIEKDKCYQQMEALHRAITHQKQQIELLSSYLVEYHKKIFENKGLNIQKELLKNDYYFLEQLRLMIEMNNKELNLKQLELVKQKLTWQNLTSYQSNLEKMILKLQQQYSKELAKKEQKEIDDRFKNKKIF